MKCEICNLDKPDVRKHKAFVLQYPGVVVGEDLMDLCDDCAGVEELKALER
jgi:hypothetical protein